MTYIEDKKNRFENMIGDMYYYGCLGYTEIVTIALIYFKNNIQKQEINYDEIIKLVHDEINTLIDLD